jgi:UDP-glucose 4-epimerase
VLALQNIEGEARSGAYNLGNGHGFSVHQVIDAVERVTGLKVPVVLAERRCGDPSILVSDSTKARDRLGWQPRIPGLAEIVRSAWAWHQRSPARAPETRAGESVHEYSMMPRDNARSFARIGP